MTDTSKSTDPHAELRLLSHPRMGWGHGAQVRALLSERDAALATVARMGAEMEALRQREAAMRAAITKAANQFSFYEDQHRAKGTPDADAKAEVNRALAAEMDAALSAAPPPSPWRDVGARLAALPHGCVIRLEWHHDSWPCVGAEVRRDGGMCIGHGNAADLGAAILGALDDLPPAAPSVEPGV